MDDLPFCSVRLSLSKALRYTLKCIPVDSKHMLQGCPIFEPGTGTVRNFSMLRHPSHETRGDSAVRETGATCQRTYLLQQDLLSVLPLGFVLKTQKNLKQKAATEATQEDAARGTGLSRGEGRQPAGAVRAHELLVRPRDPRWETCVMLQICGTWQARA